MAVSIRTLLLRRGGLVAAVTTIAIVAALLTRDFLVALIPGIQSGIVPFAPLGERFLLTYVPFAVGTFLCLWLLVPVAAQLEMRFVVSRPALATASGALLVIIVATVVLLVRFATTEGSFGLSGTGVYVDGSSLGSGIRGVLVVGLQLLVSALPAVLLFALFQWQWLKNHPANHDVAGILDV